MRLRRLAPLLALVLAACASPGRVPGSLADGPPHPADLPEPLRAGDEIADAVPRLEPRSKYGNPPSYSVHGKTYRVLASAEGFHERGIASWYGRKFHGRRTSSGEPYDMYRMTAAHKSLPLPSYVHVKNLDNGREAIVRVNDRGPFHDGRIIDLSYAAAIKLGVVGSGSAPVEIRAIDPRNWRSQQAASTVRPPDVPRPPAPVNDSAPQYLQAGSFADPVNAVALREQLGALGVEPVEIRVEQIAGDHLHRVLIGPFAQNSELEAARARLLAHRFSAIPVIQ